MTESLALRVTLQNKLAQLQQRLCKVEQDLRQTPDPDSEERAISRENDDVLERLDESDREEICQLQDAIARIDAGIYDICSGFIPIGPTSTMCEKIRGSAAAISAAINPPAENPITSIGSSFSSRRTML